MTTSLVDTTGRPRRPQVDKIKTKTRDGKVPAGQKRPRHECKWVRGVSCPSSVQTAGRRQGQRWGQRLHGAVGPRCRAATAPMCIRECDFLFYNCSWVVPIRFCRGGWVWVARATTLGAASRCPWLCTLPISSVVPDGIERVQHCPPEGGHALRPLPTEILNNFWRGNRCNMACGMGVWGDKVIVGAHQRCDFGQSRAARAVDTRNKRARDHPVCSPYLI